jgi:ribosomal protein S18 acetylase RimI-like enzyme
MSSNTQINRAIRYLSEDELSYIDMLEPIRRGTTDIIYAGADGVALYEKNSQTLMLAMQDFEKCKTLIDFDRYRLFSSHQGPIAEWIFQSGRFSHKFEVNQASFRRSKSIAACFDQIRLLSSAETDQVCQNYSTLDDRAYIERLIDRKQLWGIFEEGALAGFIGEHLEGSMGLLEILPRYRRKGYGYRLEAFLINHFLQANRVPFCQVATDNVDSLALQQKIGMELSGGSTFWVFD